MKNTAKVLFLGAALALWAHTLSAGPEDRPRAFPARDDPQRVSDASVAAVPQSAASSNPVSLVEISDMAIVENAAFSTPFECDTVATETDILASAREMFLSDNYELAEMLYKCLLRRDPDNLSAILELSVVYETTGELQYAKGLLTRAEIIQPDDPTIRERSAALSRRLTAELRTEVDSLMTAGAYEEALPKLSMLLGSQPEEAELYYQRALCYLALRNAEGALYEIDKAILLENDPRFTALQSEARTLGAARGVGALEREAKSLLATGRKADRDRALPLVSEILSRNPDHKWARKQFLALTDGGAEKADTGGAAAPGQAGAQKGLASRAADLAKRTAELAASLGRLASAAGRGLARSLDMYLPILIAATVLLVMFRSPLTSLIVRGFDPRQVLSGRLGPIDINAVFSIIHAQGGRGVLHIRSGSIKGKVYFADGEIYHCKSGKLEGREAVRRLLTQTREGYFVLTKLPRSYKKTIDIPFSLVLMDVGEKSFLESPSSSAGSASSDGASTALSRKSKMKSLLEKRS